MSTFTQTTMSSTSSSAVRGGISSRLDSSATREYHGAQAVTSPSASPRSRSNTRSREATQFVQHEHGREYRTAREDTQATCSSSTSNPFSASCSSSSASAIGTGRGVIVSDGTTQSDVDYNRGGVPASSSCSGSSTSTSPNMIMNTNSRGRGGNSSRTRLETSRRAMQLWDEGWYGLCEQVNEAVDSLETRMRERLTMENAVYSIAKTGGEYIRLIELCRTRSRTK